MLFKNRRPGILLIMFVLALIAMFSQVVPISAEKNTSVSVTISNYAVDSNSEDRRTSVTYEWMRDNLAVEGDGETHYYHQGPIFSDNISERWNPAEDTNFYDYGAVKGTRLDELCDLVGGMRPDDTLTVKASDNWRMTFAYKNVYEYSTREGPMVLTWFKDGMYPDDGYDEGMRVVWFADTSVNPEGKHVFGVWDWHEAAEEKYWYYFDEEYPTTSGISGKYITNIFINHPFWDIDNDDFFYTCNISDLESIGAQWGEEGEPGWVPEDVNRDGVVNILDGVKVGMHWGQKY